MTICPCKSKKFITGFYKDIVQIVSLIICTISTEVGAATLLYLMF